MGWACIPRLATTLLEYLIGSWACAGCDNFEFSVSLAVFSRKSCVSTQEATGSTSLCRTTLVSLHLSPRENLPTIVGWVCFFPRYPFRMVKPEARERPHWAFRSTLVTLATLDFRGEYILVKIRTGMVKIYSSFLIKLFYRLFGSLLFDIIEISKSFIFYENPEWSNF
ncbi:hypothetical protein TRFO_27918 [Tritrichomonas foetus]|uniref:Secreted protein n=1 Tax=Tritrichomonas foetus TaxID=1144522 RepID=A0A1J4K4A6_9EUKA|nr:hypothetical protein TRFO_27918 [Tritrichomonas foetus]|eukprot:OHT04588.1 hypothetical protein TRFO_27918 [Tritrichomonas foetus]